MSDENKSLENLDQDVETTEDRWSTITAEESRLIKKLHSLSRELELIKRQATDIH